MAQEFTFNWQWDLKSAPEAIWPLAADTNRFNRDTGQPEVELLSNVKDTKLTRIKLPVLRVEWGDEPFERTYTYSVGIVRRYTKGPLDEMPVNANFDPLPEGGRRQNSGERISGVRCDHSEAQALARWRIQE